MDRGVKGGSVVKRIKRTISALPESITRAVKSNPFLKKKYNLASKVPLLYFIRKPDPYIIRRATLRGKKPPGVPKIKRFEDERPRTNLNPEKGKKSETFKNVAVGTGALAGGYGIARAAHKVGKAADTADLLQRHVGKIATEAHHKINAHVDYIGHHAGNAAEEAGKTARAARKTATAYHPRAIAKMVGGKLKRVGGAIKRIVATKIFSGKLKTTNFHVMKEKHPKGEEDKDSFLKRNGVRIAGTAAGIAGTALFFKHFKPLKSGPDVTKGAGITKAAVAKSPKVRAKPEVRTDRVERSANIIRRREPVKPKERKPRAKYETPISNIRRVRKSKPKKMSAAWKKITEFATQGRDDEGKMAPKAELVPSFRKAKKIVQIGKRGGDVAQDLHDVAHGKPKDPKKKRFWEKAWFQTGVLAGAGALGIRAHRKHAEKHGYDPYFSAKLTPTEFSKLTDAIVHHKLVMATKRRIMRIASHPLLQRNPKLKNAIVSRERQKYHALVKAQPHMSLLQRHVTPTELTFLIHDPDFPIVPMKQPKLPKGMKQRVPVAQTRAEVIARMKKLTELSSGGGLGKAAAETIIDATTIGADIGPKKKKPTKAKKAADMADPDLSPTNNWTADPTAPLAKLERRIPLIYFAMKLPVGIPVTRPTPRSVNIVAAKQDFRGQSTANHGLDKFTKVAKGTRLHNNAKRTEFYGTSEGVTKSWDTRGRADRSPKPAHWWTHSPTKNSVRVVRSTSESGPRTRRGKKFHEKTSTHKAAIAVASGAALGLGGLALHKHLKFRKLDKMVHVPGHTVNVVNRKGQPPVYVSQKHAQPTPSKAVKPERKAVKKPQTKRSKTQMSIGPAMSKIIEFAGGYNSKGEKERGVMAHLKRHAATYGGLAAGTALVPGVLAGVMKKNHMPLSALKRLPADLKVKAVSGTVQWGGIGALGGAIGDHARRKKNQPGFKKAEAEYLKKGGQYGTASPATQAKFDKAVNRRAPVVKKKPMTSEEKRKALITGGAVVGGTAAAGAIGHYAHLNEKGYKAQHIRGVAGAKRTAVKRNIQVARSLLKKGIKI